MRGLLASEVRRVLSRRLTRVLGAVLLAVLVATPFVVDPAFRERARIERDADLERCVAGAAPKVRDGLPLATIPSSVQPLAAREHACARAIPERDTGFDRGDMADVLRPLGVFGIVAAFVLGASFTGTDAASGALAMLLAWEGRRARVLVTKLLAVSGTVIVAAAAWHALMIGALGATSPGGGAWAGDSAWLAGRIVVSAAAAAVVGGAVALLGRATAAALGAGLAYVAVFETLLSANFRSARPWLVLGNAIVWVNGRFEGGPGRDVPGRSVPEAAFVLGAYLTALVVVTVVVFRRRDVV